MFKKNDLEDITITELLDKTNDGAYRIKYHDISQIFHGEERLIDDFSDSDLSELDLSKIPTKCWDGAIFHNTNFEGTNIKFYPRDLKKRRVRFVNGTIYKTLRDMSSCNFKDCDLSYLKDADLKEVILSGCNLENTNIDIDFNFLDNEYQYLRMRNLREILIKDVVLPQTYGKKNMEYFDDIKLDFNFLVKNKHIKVSSGKLLEMMKDALPTMESLLLSEENEESKYKEKCEVALKIMEEYDEEGLLKRLYHDLKPCFKDYFDEPYFFEGLIKGICFDNLDLSYLTSKLISQLHFNQCDFNELVLPIGFKELNEITAKSERRVFLYFPEVKKLHIPVTSHDWDNNKATRVIGTSFTYRTDIYVELNRICNMMCTFCRNEGLNNEEYHYQKIVKNLKLIYPHLNYIVIGGGEPTLLKHDLFHLKPDVLGRDYKFHNNWYFTTNGTLPLKEYKKLSSRYHIYLSRHAIDDKENRAIFHDKNNSILSAEELYNLKRKASGKVILCCTCFKGGVDSRSKMLNYIKFAAELGYQHILFQTLHQEDKFYNGMEQAQTIDQNVIRDTLAILERNSFQISKPIYSTSEYELHIATLNNLKIHFKEYKNPKYIDQQWHQSSKRCFDLSMAPNGDIYESWNQQQKPIKVKKR